jgi:glycosyltransferase involved in cell wall biosynthesis
VSVHDISFVEHNEWFSKRDQLVLRLGVRSSIHLASAVLTISNFSKKAILKHYKSSHDKTFSIPIGVDLERFINAPPLSSERKREYGITKPYILALGNIQPRKNIVRLIDAFCAVQQKIKTPIQLILAGKAQYRHNDIVEQVARLGLKEQVKFTGYIKDEDLASLYSGSDIFVYPSLYEGFGLPILEAMASGTAVISSKTTAMPEVGGDAVHYIEPTDTEDIANAIIKLINDKSYREKLIEKGTRRVKSYTWHKTALDTLKVYREILHKKEF